MEVEQRLDPVFEASTESQRAAIPSNFSLTWRTDVRCRMSIYQTGDHTETRAARVWPLHRDLSVSPAKR